MIFKTFSIQDYYVARHAKNHSMEHHEIDHAIGWFDPSDGMGKVYATVASEERSFLSGEILVATEPIRYELHDINFSKLKLRTSKNRTLLGQTMLKNEGEEAMDAKAVIGYEFDVVKNFGSLEGIARTINTTAFMKNEQIEFIWGLEKKDHAVNSKGVGTMLLPGTALNITLWGNYTTNEGPYQAKLVTYWADGSKSKKRHIHVSSVSFKISFLNFFFHFNFFSSRRDWTRTWRNSWTLSTVRSTGCTTIPSCRRPPSERPAPALKVFTSRSSPRPCRATPSSESPRRVR